MKAANKQVFKDVWKFIKFAMLPPVLISLLIGDPLFNFLYENPYTFFVILAAICNACMDKVSHHFSKSVFKNKPARWWNPSESWKRKYKTTGKKLKLIKTPWYKPDALSDFWHVCKTSMIVSIALAIVTYNNDFELWRSFLVVGILWNWFFVLFYEIILARK